MKIAHIIGNDKFVQDYINLVNSNFSKCDHIFLVLDFDDNVMYAKVDNWDNVIYISKGFKGLRKLVKYMKKAEKIIFHGMFSRQVMAMICILGFSKKTYCALWGGDLYRFGNETRIEYVMKRHIISKSRGIIMELEDDYDLARKWYGATCPYFNCMLYLSNIVERKDRVIANKQQGESTVIQIGNSANPSNRHQFVLDVLAKYRDENVKILLPLSYGGDKYAEEVISYAREIFGDKVIALKDFMPLNQYLSILDSVDIAIFAHKRQQGLGNILTLLSKGKKVYIPSEVTVYQALSRIGIKVFDTNKICDDIFNRLSEEEIRTNLEKVYKISNIDKLICDWKKVFDD